MKRRFVTKVEVDRCADAGDRELRLEGLVTVTDAAAERARERGVRLVRDPAPGPAGQAGPPEPPRTPAGERVRTGTRDQVRAAVVKALGTEPPALDEVIDRVLREHS